MNKLGILLKTNLINSLGLNNIKHNKKTRVKNTFTGIGFVLAVVFVASLIMLYSSAMAMVLKEAGMLDLILISSMIISSLIIFITSIYKAQGILFAGKDFESLTSLPIKTSTIITSKIVELLIFNYLFIALIIFPTSIIYYINSNVGLLFFVYMFIAFLFIPVIPVVLASILAFCFTFIAARTKHKNLILTVISLIFFTTLIVLSFKMNDFIAYIVANKNSIIEAIKTIYPPAHYYSKALSNLDIVSLGMMMFSSIIVFILFVVIFGKNYKSINSKMRDNHKKSNYEFTKVKTSSQLNSLIKKELRRYFSSTIYVMNTTLGLVLIIIAAVIAIFIGKKGLIESFIGLNNAEFSAIVPYINEFIQYIPIILICLGVSLSCTTSSSISLEGKNLWILRSAPVKTADILKAKVTVNLIILIPAIVLSTILFWIGFDLSLTIALWTFLIPSLLAVFISVSGIIINLNFPKLNWKNETQVIKQSLSVMVSIILNIALLAIILGLCYISIRFLNITNMNTYLIEMAVLFFILDFIGISILKKTGEKLFNNLNC